MMFDREYYFYGKHADMVRKLTTNWNDKIGASVFERNLDVYEIAPIIGWIYNRKAEVERDEENKTRIFRDKMLDDRPQLLFNYRNLMLLNGEKWDSEERMDIALYNSYVLGGVEVLYERIFDNASKPEEYLMNFYEFLEELEVRIYKKDVGLE